MNAFGKPGGERGARHRDRAHGNAADGAGRPGAGAIGDQRAERGERAGQQDRALGVDVVLGVAAAGERDLADHQRVLAQVRPQAGACGVQAARRFGHRVH